MFETIEKNKNLKEFGLYRYDSEEDCYKERKKNIFNFQYFVVLLTTVIILTAICVVTYTYIREANKPPKNITFFDLNLNEIIDTTTYTTPLLDYEEPIALELKNKNRRDDPRPFLYEIRDPQPMGFRFPREDQNADSQTVKPLKYRGRNIQEIIKLLEQGDSRKKLKTRRKNYQQDPFYPFKPQNPSDINLLAVNNYKFAPSVQNEVKKTPDYPKYELPQDVSLENPYNKRQKHKVLNNQNNYFNHVNRFHQNRIQQYWNRPQWNYNNQNMHRKKNIAQPMIVHLNLYPKKKKKHNDNPISESNIYQNCTDADNHHQISNTTQFNHLMEQVQHSFHNNNNSILHFKFKLNNDNKINDFKYLPTENTQNNNVEIQKSIAFTVLNQGSNSSQWRPMFVDSDGNYGGTSDNNAQLQVGEANDFLQVQEPVTLPLPNEIYQQYFNRKPTQKFSKNWEWDKIRENPNLVNHKPSFEDRNKEK